MARRLLRIIEWLGILLGVLLVAAAWLATREGTLQWAARKLPELTGGAVVLEEVHGTVLGPITVGKARYADADLRITAEQLDFDWELAALLVRPHVLHIERLRAERVEVAMLGESTGPTPPPDTLQVPVAITVDRAEVGELAYTSGETRLDARQVALAYAVDARAHRLTIERAESELGVLAGRVTLGADAPFPVDGAFSLDGRFEAYPYQLRGTVAGTLSELRIVAANSAPPLVADVDAVVTPFAELPVRQARVRAEGVDVRAFEASAPATDLAVELDVRPLPDGRFAGDFHVANRAAGPIDRERVPFTDAAGRFEGTPTDLALDALTIDLGKGGHLAGRGGFTDGRLHFDLTTPRLNLKGLHDKLQDTRLAGALTLKVAEDAQTLTIDLSQQGYRIEGEVVHRDQEVDLRSARVRAKGGELTLRGRVALTGSQAFSAEGSVARFDPAAFGDFPKASLNGSFTATGSLAPQWSARVNLTVAESSRFRGAPLAGGAKLDVTEQRVADADVALRLGANRLSARGAFGSAGDRLAWNVEITEPAVVDPRLGGRLVAEGVLEGTPAQPAGRFAVEAKALSWERDLAIAELTGSGSVERGLDGNMQLTLQSRDVKSGTQRLDTASVAASGTLGQHEIRLAGVGPALDATAMLVGGRSASGWSGRVTQLENRGPHPVRLLEPVALEIGDGRFVLGAASLRLGDGMLRIAGVRRVGGTLETSGEFSAIALAYLLDIAGQKDAVDTNLELGGRWSLRADQSLNCALDVARETGDVLLPTRPPTALGLTRLALAVQCVDDRIRATFDAAGSEIGTATAAVETRASRREGAWGIAGTAPLTLEARASVSSLAWIGALAEDAVSVAGKLDVAVTGSGTVAAPDLQGTVTGSAIELGLPEAGVFLSRGTLQGTFEADRFVLDNLTLHGGDGTLTATGVYDFSAGGGLKITAVADRLELLTRPGQKLTVSGNLDGSVIDGRVAATGKITADNARIEVLPQTKPTLASDIVIKGEEQQTQERAAGGPPADIDLELNLGEKFYVKAFGLDGRLAGSIKVRARDRELPTATGSIRIVDATYEAFGQRLSVGRGIITFSGPIDNPGVNVLALRKNQTVEAGVSVTGTVSSPTVKLVSVPEVPDPEKLSWLMFGRPPDPSARDNDVLAAATASLIAAGGSSLLGTGNKGLGLGLDTVGMRSDERTSEQVVTVGKRFSDRVYVAYERSVSGAVNVTKVRYILSRRWSVEAATGTSNAIDVFFTLFFN
jgi:translocation and assembly module TamB